MIQNKTVHCLYVDKMLLSLRFKLSVFDCTHHQSCSLSVGQCGCIAAVQYGGLLCLGPPLPRPRPAHTLVSAAVKSHDPQAQLQEKKRENDSDLRY